MISLLLTQLSSKYRKNDACDHMIFETFFLFQVASNTATANVLLPILADLSMTICQNPLYLIMAAAVTSSYAFMLPVATAPNAIGNSKKLFFFHPPGGALVIF